MSPLKNNLIAPLSRIPSIMNRKNEFKKLPKLAQLIPEWVAQLIPE